MSFQHINPAQFVAKRSADINTRTTPMQSAIMIDWPTQHASMHTSTDGLVGGAKQLVAAGVAKGAELRSGLFGRKFATLEQDVLALIQKQTSYFISEKNAKVNQWIAEIKRYTDDLKSASRAYLSAEKLPNTNKKRASKIRKAEKAIEAAKTGIQKAKGPYTAQNAAALFDTFKLDKYDPTDKLEQVRISIEDAIAGFEKDGAYTKAFTSAAETMSDKLIAALENSDAAVKAAPF